MGRTLDVRSPAPHHYVGPDPACDACGLSRQAPVHIQSPRLAECYSDHAEDIRTKGSCDYCGGTE